MRRFTLWLFFPLLLGSIVAYADKSGIGRFDKRTTRAAPPTPTASPIQLILEESGPAPDQAAALDSVVLLRDPFPIVNFANLLNPGSDKNTRIAIFATNLQLAPGEPSASVVINLIDSNNQSYDVAAEDVRPVANSPFAQVIFRLPTNLAAGTCTVRITAQGQVSNAGKLRVGVGENFSDDFSTAGDRLNRIVWTTEIGPGSFLGRTQLRDWINESGVGRFNVANGNAQLALDTFNPTGFSLYGTHAKTRMSFQPSPTTDVVLAVRMRLATLQRGIVFGVYFYRCGAFCSNDHDEADIEVVTNYLQPGVSPLKVQLNRYAAEPLGAGHGPIVNLSAGFDPLAYHEWKIRWGASRLTYYVDNVELFSTTTFVPQRPMHADMIAWGPASDWSAAYDASLQPTNNQNANQRFYALVDYFTVKTVPVGTP
jgi:glycosyl hydrolase family 16